MASPQNPVDRQKKRISDLDEKWKMLFNERPRPPLYSVDKYIEYLRKFTTPPSPGESTNGNVTIRSKSSGTSTGISAGTSTGISAGQQVSYLLKKLKLDLKMSYERFLENFICNPNNGLVLLVTLLKHIQKTSREDQRGTVREKMQSRKRIMSEELECILCIKFCLRYKASAKILLEIPYGLENVAEVLLSSNVRSRCTALEIMSKILMEDEGFHRNLECFTYFRLKNSEPVRFKFLINMLMTAGSSSVQVSFQICCMKYINSLLTSSPDGNTRIFLQSEVEMAGLDVKALMKSAEMKSSPEKDELKQEIIDFRNSLLDVDQLLESHETLYKLNIELHQKLLELQEQLQLKRHQDQQPDRVELQGGYQPEHKREDSIEFQPENKNTDSINYPPENGILDAIDCHLENEYEDSIDEEQDKENEVILGLNELDELLDSIDSDNDVSSIELHLNTPQIRRRGSNRNWRKAGRQLPVLNQTDICLSTTMEKQDKNVIKGLGKIHYVEQSQLDLPKTENDHKETQKIQFIEKSRAEKFLTVKNNVGLSSEIIVECLQNCDAENIAPEYVNKLLDLLPTEDEMRNILTLDCELDNLGEAEQFLVQIMSVERLEEKLKIMVFVEQFKSLIDGMSEDVFHIKESATSLLLCQDFQTLLELIKNYMVDNYYTTPLDFRLSSLIMLENTNLNVTSQNLLEYFVTLVYTTYPKLLFWYKDVSIKINSKVSFRRFIKFIEETNDGLSSMEVEKTRCLTEHLDQLYNSVRQKFDEFYQNFLEMELTYGDMCTMFRENSTDIDPPILFGYVTQFVESFKSIAEELETKDLTVCHTPEPDPDYMSERANTVVEVTPHTNDENDRLSEDLTVSELESFGLQVTTSINERERIKNWIVMTTPSPSMNIEVIGEHYNKQWYKSKYSDSDSGDSAFEGSGGRGLTRYVEMTKEDCERQRTSTPVTSCTPVIPCTPVTSCAPVTSRKPVDEPPPDYSRSNSPEMPDKQFDDLSSEVSRILRDFEGDLNGYETHLTSPINRRFYTIRSIIHL